MSSNVKNVVKTAKSELRSDLLQQIRNAELADKTRWSESIQKNLKEVFAERQGYWGAFNALTDEPQIEWSAISGDIQWCFPKTENQILKFIFGSSSYQRSTLGVQEPVQGKEIALSQLQGVVVPGVGFSPSGHRLGRGKGFYDQTLSVFAGLKVGVCFGLAIKAEIPHESHDVLFHQIVTEDSIYQVGHPEGDLKWN